MIDKAAYPTVGRIVLFHDPEHVEPFAGLVAVAEANRYTIPHLAVFLHDGLRMVEGVKHKDCVKLARGEAYWDWMPYQKGQAAKTEALQAQLERATGTMIPHVAHHPTNPNSHTSDSEISKTQSSTPSPVDGKR